MDILIWLVTNVLVKWVFYLAIGSWLVLGEGYSTEHQVSG